MYKYLLMCRKFNKVFILCLIIIFIFIDIFSTKCSNTNVTNITDNKFTLNNLLINNTGYYLLLLIGFLSFNISSYPLVAYNSFFWGVIFKTALCKSNLVNAISLFFPHIFFEIFWIVKVTGISTQFSVLLYEEFNNLKIIKLNGCKIFKELSLGYLILIIGVLIEFYITNKF